MKMNASPNAHSYVGKHLKTMFKKRVVISRNGPYPYIGNHLAFFFQIDFYTSLEFIINRSDYELCTFVKLYYEPFLNKNQDK